MITSGREFFSYNKIPVSLSLFMSFLRDWVIFCEYKPRSNNQSHPLFCDLNEITGDGNSDV